MNSGGDIWCIESDTIFHLVVRARPAVPYSESTKIGCILPRSEKNACMDGNRILADFFSGSAVADLFKEDVFLAQNAEELTSLQACQPIYKALDKQRDGIIRQVSENVAGHVFHPKPPAELAESRLVDVAKVIEAMNARMARNEKLRSEMDRAIAEKMQLLAVFAGDLRRGQFDMGVGGSDTEHFEEALAKSHQCVKKEQ